MLTEQTIHKNLAKQLGLNTKLYFKREDLHPFGSHKGRSIPLMIDKYQTEGWKNFVISSSGNAALAAIYSIQKYHKKQSDDLLNLKIFLGKNIAKNKLNKLKKVINNQQNITLKQVERPKQQAFILDKQGQAKFLRQSTDDTALKGYYVLAKELSKIKNLRAVFVPTSSGTTAQGLYQGFKKLNINPQIHIVQTTSCHPMVEKEKKTEEKSLATAIVDKIAHRKTKILEVIKDSQGNGWIASNEEIIRAIKLVKQTENIDISANSALTIVGLQQAISQELKFNGSVVCIITGR